jgi:hypothetical protein
MASFESIITDLSAHLLKEVEHARRVATGNTEGDLSQLLTGAKTSLLAAINELTSSIGFKKPMHGKGIRNNCFTVLICFYSPLVNNGSIDTFVGFLWFKKVCYCYN